MKSIKQYTIRSGNTFGATFWTDGKSQVSMLLDQPKLILCPHCHVLLWMDELDELGKIEPSWDDEQSKFQDACDYEMPSFNDYFVFINNCASDPHKERYARLCAWWAGNDQRRTNASEIPLSPLEEENMTALAHMLNESDSNDLVMKAEIMRELGRFDEAISLLTKSVDENISQEVKIIKNLAKKHDPYVRKMHFK